MKQKKLFSTCLLFMFFGVLAQEKIEDLYLDSEGFPKVIVVSSISYHAQNMLTLNVYKKLEGIAENKDIAFFVSYKYLGIDNQTLRLQREELNCTTKEKDICNLYFKIDQTKPTEITLIGQEFYKGSLIKLQIEATNNFIKTKYIGNLPKYVK